jgi:hypothetical protein
MFVYQKQKDGTDKQLGNEGNGINFWECDPTDNENNCIFYYRGDPKGEGEQYKEYNFEVPCKCSLATSN